MIREGKYYPPEARAEMEANSEKQEHHHLTLTHEQLSHIDEKMEDEYPLAWGHTDEEFARKNSINEAQYMIPGSLKLIEKVMEAAESEDPYDVLVFLDKSARPSAYLYRRLWTHLQEKGLIDKSTERPRSQFMDIGKGDTIWKDDAPLDNDHVREVIKPEYVTPRGSESKVLIVDEFKESGRTLNRAKTIFEDIYGVEPETTYQFAEQQAPMWYKSTSQKLVEDAQISERAHTLLSATDEDLEKRGFAPTDRESLKYLARHLPREAFINLYEHRLDDFFDMDDEGKESKESELEAEIQEFVIEKQSYDPSNTESDFEEELQNIRENIQRIAKSNLVIDPESVYDYYNAAAGHLSVARRDHHRESGVELRKMLNKVAELTTEELAKANKKA